MSTRVGLIAVSWVRVENERLMRLGLTLASVTPPGYDVTYLESPKFDPAQFSGRDFDIVGISSFTAKSDVMYRIADFYRARGTAVVLGGLHCTLVPDEAAAHADAVVVGEGEALWSRVLHDFRAGKLQSEYRNASSSTRHEFRHRRTTSFDSATVAERPVSEDFQGWPRVCPPLRTMDSAESICMPGSATLVRRRRDCRAVVLAVATLALLTIAAVFVLAVAVVTLGRARRLYAEVIATWLSRAILAMWSVRLEVHQDAPFPETQTVYVSNHSSTLDMFVLVALGLPNTRFVGAQDLDGFLRWMAPLGVFTSLMGTRWAPPPSKPVDRARWFAATERLLRRTGGSIYLSPEGERVTTGRIGRFNQDNFQLAANLTVSIVPLYIEIPRDIDPRKGFDALPGTVRVHVQRPISTDGWMVGQLASNTEMVRDMFVRLHTEHHP